MALLRQTGRPASAANWTEYLYAKEVKIVGGEVEVDDADRNTIDLLLGRGFEIVDSEKKDVPVRILGKVIYADEVEPQGTQMVEADDAPEVSEAKEQESEAEVEETPAPEAVAAEPEPTPPQPQKRGRGRPRKNPQGAK